jgi:hypothetical protein
MFTIMQRLAFPFLHAPRCGLGATSITQILHFTAGRKSRSDSDYQEAVGIPQVDFALMIMARSI